jgi:hypothetical protein
VTRNETFTSEPGEPQNQEKKKNVEPKRIYSFSLKLAPKLHYTECNAFNNTSPKGIKRITKKILKQEDNQNEDQKSQQKAGFEQKHHCQPEFQRNEICQRWRGHLRKLLHQRL